jgi:murein DD-endopeptidase MepM/ murein hydrolase activator NlpD
MKGVCAAVVALVVGCAGAQQPMPAGTEMHGGGAAFLGLTPERAVELGGEDIQRFYDGDEVALWTQMSAAMRAAVQNQDVLKSFTEHMAKYFGTEAQVIHQDAVFMPPAGVQYTRIVRYSKTDELMVVTFTFSGSGTIEEFHIKVMPQAADSKYVDYHDKTKLEFPLRGEWTIYQGGRMVAENEHATTTNERFAYEMVRMDTGQMFTHNGAANEAWFAFGQPVLADANGTVVKVANDYVDNAPYRPDAEAKHGNVVVIDHGDGEFSVYSHLKHGSVTVKIGDRVKTGDKIAEVGNSGDTLFPRLEYSLQTSADLNGSDGLPAAFQHLKVNGKHKKNVELVRGDVVEKR